MKAFSPYTLVETRFRRGFAIATLVVAASLGSLMLVLPNLDLMVASAVKSSCVGAPGAKDWCAAWYITGARRAFQVLFVLAAVVALVGLIRALVIERQWLGLRQVRWAFVVLVALVGPGLIANVLIKDNFGRARPRDVVEFGGGKAFTPPLVPSEACQRNCSFVSGEASSMFAFFFGLALVLPHIRVSLITAGVLAGFAAGGIRILQGAHFLSDVVFAGIFMAVTVSLLHVLLIGIWRDWRWPTQVAVWPALARMRVRA